MKSGKPISQWEYVPLVTNHSQPQDALQRQSSQD